MSPDSGQLGVCAHSEFALMVEKKARPPGFYRRWLTGNPPFPALGYIRHVTARQDAGQLAPDKCATDLGISVPKFAQQAVFTFFPGALPEPCLRPLGFHPFACHPEMQMSGVDILGAFARDRGSCAVVPNQDGAAIIFILRHGSFEFSAG